jgi:N-acetyl-alpha-D-muramate 1-phosphate uridylyltransferase
MLPVAILAGGLATRLRPITETIPKSLVDVGGMPFVLRQLDYLRHQGVTLVVLCIGYLGEQIEAIVGDGSAYGLDVRYSRDGAKQRGTGGAIKQALPMLGQQFFVLYGDSYLPIDFQAVEKKFKFSGGSALLTILQNNDRWDKSNVEFNNGRIIEYNKHVRRPEMAHIDYGLGVLSAVVFKDMSCDGPFDLSDVYHTLSLRGELAGHEVFERFYEIGSPKGLQETIRFFNEEDNL